MRDVKDIYVVTPTGTGSTLLVNIVYGLFLPHEPVVFIGQNCPLPPVGESMNIYKSHMMVMYEFDAFKISIERPGLEKYIPSRYKNMKHSLTFQYKEILYKSKYTPDVDKTLNEVVQMVADRICEAFNMTISDKQISDCIRRVENMDKKYEELKDLSFRKRFIDEFYQIHGGHRQRKKPVWYKGD